MNYSSVFVFFFFFFQKWNGAIILSSCCRFSIHSCSHVLLGNRLAFIPDGRALGTSGGHPPSPHLRRIWVYCLVPEATLVRNANGVKNFLPVAHKSHFVRGPHHIIALCHTLTRWDVNPIPSQYYNMAALLGDKRNCLYKYSASWLVWTNSVSSTLQHNCLATYLPSYRQDILCIAGEVRTGFITTFSYGHLRMDPQVLAD